MNTSLDAPAAALVRKLGVFIDLTQQETAALRDLGRDPARFGDETDFVTFGGQMENVLLLERGWAARHKLTVSGDRMITNFFLPGDFMCLHAPLFKVADHGVTSITPVTVARISIERFLGAMRASPRLALAIAWCAAKEEALLEEHMVSTARRSAYARMAHLLVELWRRLELRGLTEDHRYMLPLTQQEIADSLGLSLWYTNRVMHALSRNGLIAFETPSERRVRILDKEGLTEAAGFKDEYLHFTEIPARTARMFPRNG